MNLERVRDVLHERGEPVYRLAQIKRAFFVEHLSDWSELTTLSKALRDNLSAHAPWSSLIEEKRHVSKSGDTTKCLYQTSDGKKIETVLMQHEGGRNTVCLSSQIGCAMACSFCATGTMGLKRNLTVDEMVDQVLAMARLLKPEGAHVTNIVFMGMGEPMHNLDNVLQTIHILNDQEGFCLGARHMTISTCGIVPGIRRLAEEPLQINLAISLHSPFDDVRSKIMPVNNAYPLAKLMAAVDDYVAKTNRKVFFEYLLLRGMNDRDEDADGLEELLGHNRRLYHVNLIKYHDTDMFEATPRPERMDFLDKLRQRHVPATHRVSFGEDIDAACGQLAVNDEKGQVEEGKAAIKANRESKKVKA